MVEVSSESISSIAQTVLDEDIHTLCYEQLKLKQSKQK